mmetsp:Transcript_85780/g.243305  ORF Transcript_85780/g.243305 Transcript_85780/m.243305 type:complete len:464 (-) Transcript_85780:109-1500(-)
MEDPCPPCSGNPSLCADEAAPPGRARAPERRSVWMVDLGFSQVRYDADVQQLITEALAAGRGRVETRIRGQGYVLDLKTMEQINKQTRVSRPMLRREVEEDEGMEEDGSDEDSASEDSMEEDAPEEGEGAEGRGERAPTPRSQRLAGLVEHLLSPAVRVPLFGELAEERARLSAAEIEQVFSSHVPGVQGFLYRGKPGVLSLNFVKTAYSEGIRCFQGTPLHDHLTWLLRAIVHHGHMGRPGAAGYLRQVAEAFTDCQAVQARVIEHVGLEILGVAADFRGLVTQLLGDYKRMAVQMLARDRLDRGLAKDYDDTPTHYENRLTADLGDALGLNENDVRLAAEDHHARSRFTALRGRHLQHAARRCRELSDVRAFLYAFMSEVNRFGESTPADSLPRKFIAWADGRLRQKHIVFDAETCMRVAVEEPLALAVVEALLLGRPSAPAGEMYRGVCLRDAFLEQGGG